MAGGRQGLTRSAVPAWHAFSRADASTAPGPEERLGAWRSFATPALLTSGKAACMQETEPRREKVARSRRQALACAKAARFQLQQIQREPGQSL